ncbi:uncharacterized protein [Physcomitrium patens]|uniref:uncharacterized protein n=1 Tax=Physcomitrium patens TaxID=3218 RepID=UPI003CCD964A
MRSVARKRGGESKRNSRGSRIRRHEAAGPNCGGGEQEAKPAEAGLSGNATPCGGGEARALRSLVQVGVGGGPGPRIHRCLLDGEEIGLFKFTDRGGTLSFGFPKF